jgi:membrane-bound hydrogenase subunit mbhJ
MIKVFRVNTGSCGGCDLEIAALLANEADFAPADTVQNADIVLLTGPITMAIRPFFQALLAEIGSIPLVAVGACAIDGHPFGRGGSAALPDATVAARISGCPPESAAIADVLRQVANSARP